MKFTSTDHPDIEVLYDAGGDYYRVMRYTADGDEYLTSQGHWVGGRGRITGQDQALSHFRNSGRYVASVADGDAYIAEQAAAAAAAAPKDSFLKDFEHSVEREFRDLGDPGNDG